MLTRRGFLRAMVAAPAIILTPGLLMPVRRIITPSGEIANLSNFKLHPMQWSNDGLRWTDDVAELSKDDGMPLYVFHRRWITAEELRKLYP